MAKRKNRTIRKRVKTAKSQTEFIADIRDESDEIEEAKRVEASLLVTTRAEREIEARVETESEKLLAELEPIPAGSIKEKTLKGPKVRKEATPDEELQFLGEWLAQEYLSIELNYDPLKDHHATRNNKLQPCDGKDPNGREIEIRTQKRTRTNFVIPKDYIERVKTVERLVICEYDNSNTIQLWEVSDRSVNEKNKTFALPIKQMQLLLSFDNQEFADKMRSIKG